MMMIRARCLLIFLLLSFSAYSRNNLKYFFKSANVFFYSYVKEGKVDYLSIKENPGGLKALLKNISSIDPGSLRGKKFKAYLTNVYNILVIDQVLKFYPLISPYETSGFFTRRDFNIGGRSVSLNDVKEMLMNKYSDPRIYGFLCNSTLGTPLLCDHAYKTGGLNKKLNQQFKKMSNDRNFVRWVPKASLILFSDAFRGYENYLVKEKMIKLINKFREKKLPLNFEIGLFPGNCNLNIIE